MMDLNELAARVEAGKGRDNRLDVEIEVALYNNCRSNAAGTKVIYTEAGGIERTYWAAEWTEDRADVAALLRRAHASKDRT